MAQNLEDCPLHYQVFLKRLNLVYTGQLIFMLQNYAKHIQLWLFVSRIIMVKVVITICDLWQLMDDLSVENKLHVAIQQT